MTDAELDRLSLRPQRSAATQALTAALRSRGHFGQDWELDAESYGEPVDVLTHRRTGAWVEIVTVPHPGCPTYCAWVKVPDASAALLLCEGESAGDIADAMTDAVS